MPDAQGEWINLTFGLGRSTLDATKGPILRWWVMRALPAVEGAQTFIVPLRLEQKTRLPAGIVKDVAVQREMDFIAGLINNRQVVKYQEGKVSYDVYVVNMEQRPEQWARMDHGLEGILLVELQTVN
jgi:hypothetical protein